MFNALLLTVTLAVSATLLLSVNAAPAKLDSNDTPFALELQPPLLDAPAIDSYGNPIDALTPIDTPDGRKVISTQGVQFEIPNYASGITEIRKPADDLLPPHIAHLDPQNVPTPPPRAVHEEQFPPFQQGAGADAAINQKVEYTKSDEGKVITTPITSGSTAQRKDTPSNSLFNGFSATSTTANSAPTAASNTDKFTGSFGAPAGVLLPENPVSPPASVSLHVANGQKHEIIKPNKVTNKGQYTGGFGGPTGFLSSQASEPRPFSTQSRFGGPPGVLVPFDNVQQ